MSNLNLMRPDEWRRPAIDNHHVEPPSGAKGATAFPPDRPGYARRNRTELVVLIVGLCILAWMILMQDVRVGLPGLATVPPVEGGAGSPDVGSSSPRALPPGRPTSPEPSQSPATRTSPGSISP